MLTWSVTRSQQRPQTPVALMVNRARGRPQLTVNVVQGHHKDLNSSVRDEFLPPLRTELGTYCPVKSSSRGAGMGGRARARSNDVERFGQERTKTSSWNVKSSEGEQQGHHGRKLSLQTFSHLPHLGLLLCGLVALGIQLPFSSALGLWFSLCCWGC